MTLQPYPSISKIAAKSAEKGHVVATENETLVISTTDDQLTFHSTRDIRDSEGKPVDMKDALARLDITL